MGADVINILDSNNFPRNLFRKYGLLLVQNISDNATAKFLGQQNRAAQDSRQLYQCLENSIFQDVRENIVEEVGIYHMAGMPVGALFFKHLMSKAVVDTM
eukprot:7174682-Ditylum_brightwellii.AAC.1